MDPRYKKWFLKPYFFKSLQNDTFNFEAIFWANKEEKCEKKVCCLCTYVVMVIVQKLCSLVVELFRVQCYGRQACISRKSCSFTSVISKSIVEPKHHHQPMHYGSHAKTTKLAPLQKNAQKVCIIHEQHLNKRGSLTKWHTVE